MADFNYNVDVLPIQFTPAPGPPGDSAYTVAIAGGFVGSEEAWLTSLVGPSGPSAYSIAVANGYPDTEAAWLVSLEGESAYAIAVDNGYNGDEVSWLASLIGPPGASAYQTWLQNGNAGTEAEFLNSLIGAKGPSGDSAYSIAVQNGFSGSEAQWLASLVGPSGSTTWSAISGKPATFPPSPHTHAESDVTNLVADLNNRVLTSTVVQGGQSLSGGGALTSTTLTLTLVNDSASPGAGRFYATNLSGVRGWIPYGTAASVNVPGSGNATNAQAVLGNDTRLADSRLPKVHAATHGSGGSDQVTLLRAQISDLPGLVNTSSMGFAPQLPSSNPTGVFFRGDGNYASPKPGSIGGHISTPVAQSYTIDLAAAASYTIIKFIITLSAGTCTVAVNRNGAAISGLGAIAVTSASQAISLSQVVNTDDLIALAVSAPSGAANLQYSMRYQK
jgi:hypothetical protein